MKFVLNENDGSHYIVYGGLQSPSRMYESITSIRTEDRLFIGCTQYWEGTLPIEQVLEVIQVEKAGEDKV